jgi:hypothetical protein
VITIISLGALAIDSTAPEPTQTVNFHESVELGVEPVEIGDVKVTNNYVLPQQYEINDFETCGDKREFRVSIVEYSESNGVISGLSSKNVEYEASKPFRHPENASTEQLKLDVVDECGEDVNGTVQIKQRENDP